MKIKLYAKNEISLNPLIIVYKKGKIISEETRKKSSISHSRPCPWNVGKKRSEESKLKMSLAHIGKPSGKKGKIVSEETRKKI